MNTEAICLQFLVSSSLTRGVWYATRRDLSDNMCIRSKFVYAYFVNFWMHGIRQTYDIYKNEQILATWSSFAREFPVARDWDTKTCISKFYVRP